MSIMYQQNLMNSFVYRHTYLVESPLCQRCNLHEQTPFHVIHDCNDHREEIREIILSSVGAEEVQLADTITLLNCSRKKEFIDKCLTVLSEGEFRQTIELD